MKTAIPSGQVEHFARRSGLTEGHAERVMAQNLRIGDVIPVYVKNSHTRRYPITNGHITFHLHER